MATQPNYGIAAEYPTSGKVDVIRLAPDVILANEPLYTGRVERTSDQIDVKVKSLLKEGQLTALIAVKRTIKGLKNVPVLIAGRTRALAAKVITDTGLTNNKGVTFGPENPFLLEVKFIQANDVQAIVKTFTENNSRTDANALDELGYVLALEEQVNEETGKRYTDSEIAVVLDVDPSWVSGRRSFALLGTAARAAIISGNLSTADAAKFLTNVDQTAQSEVIEVAKAEVGPGKKVTTAALRNAVRTIEAKTGESIAAPASLKRSDAETWKAIREIVSELPAGPVAALLFGIKEFRDGAIGFDGLKALALRADGAEESEAAAA